MSEDRINRLRTWRTTGVVMAVLEAGLFLAHTLISGGWPGTLILGIMTLFWAAVAVRNTWKIRTSTAIQDRPASRVDWTLVRIMEHEVYGRIFHHDGAPGISGKPAEAAGRAGRSSFRCAGCGFPFAGRVASACYCQYCGRGFPATRSGEPS